MNIKPLFNITLAIASAMAFSACSDDNNDNPDPIIDPVETAGLYVINQGNFGASNSSISFYNPTDDKVTNDVFYTANNIPAGANAQSMTIVGDNAWIVINNSHIVYKADPATLKLKGSIEGINSPRYFHQVSDTKAYVTKLNSNTIAIVDPSTCKVTGEIEVPGMDATLGSTEMMEQVGKYVYVNCWSYQNSVIRIDTTTDKVDASLEVGLQPKSMVKDKNNNLWLLTDGSYEGSPVGHEEPRLVKVTTADFKVAETFVMNLNDYTPSLAINGEGDQLYWICNDVYTMSINDKALPSTALIDCGGNYYYGLTVDPLTSDIYIADAIDYVQAGRLLRYTSKGSPINTVNVGICPQGFCWYLTTK